MDKVKIEDQEHPIIFFDGFCGLCNSFVDFVLKKDREAIFKFAPLQGNTAKSVGVSLDQYHSVVLFTGGKKYIKSSAAIKIISDLGGGYATLKLLLIFPAFIRNAVYDFIAAKRYKWFGKRETCRIPKPEERLRFLP